MDNLKEKIIELIKHLNSEEIIEINNIDALDNQTFEDIVVLLRDKFKETYPDTKLKRMMKSVHYANGFSDETLKQSAFVLDEVEQYLSLNKFLNHDASVRFFNKKITSKGFVVNQNSLVGVMIESLLGSKKKK